MKFTVNSTELQRSLSKIAGVLPSRSTMPILENVLCELSGDTLTLTATDRAVSLSVAMTVQGSADGKAAIPGRRLVETVRSLPDVVASFTIDEGTHRIKISTENGEYVLVGEGAKEFPQVPPVQGGGEMSFPADILRRIIHRTTFAVSGDELRPAMMGVLFQATDGDLRLVATDGHRLVRLLQKGVDAGGLARDVIVPAKALSTLARSIESGAVSCSVGTSHVRFSFGSTVLISRLIDESYPNYESVIPTDNTKTLEVRREDLIASIRRVALYASATTHQVRLQVSGSTLEVSAQDVDFGGEARETIPCTYTGEGIEIGFNSSYVLDLLSHLDGETVAFRFSTPTRAAVVAPVEHTETEDVLMLVMPVRLAG
jgi:DNA polymerase-3 subunit beta